MDYLTTGPYDSNAFNDASTKALTENLLRIEALSLANLLPAYTTTPYNAG